MFTDIAHALLFILCLIPASQEISIDSFEVPHLVEVGSNALLHCKVSLAPEEGGRAVVQWWWTPLHDSFEKKKIIYQHITGSSPKALYFDHELMTSDSDTFMLKNMQPKYSGTYECKASYINETQRSADLIVYSKGLGPQLNISEVSGGADNVTEDQVLVSCSADNVTPRPTLALTIINELMVQTESESNNDGFFSISLNKSVSRQKADEMEISCDLFFNNTDILPAKVTETYRDPRAVLSTTEAPAFPTQVDHPVVLLQNQPNGSCRATSIASLLALLWLSFYRSF